MILHFFSFRYIVMKLLPSTERIRKAREFFRKTAKEIINEHVKTYDPNNLRDYIDSYLHHANELDKRGEKHSFTSKFLSANFNKKNSKAINS